MYWRKAKKQSAKEIKELHDFIATLPLEDCKYRCTLRDLTTGDYASFQGTLYGEDIIFTRKIDSTPGMKDIMPKCFADALHITKQISGLAFTTEILIPQK